MFTEGLDYQAMWREMTMEILRQKHVDELNTMPRAGFGGFGPSKYHLERTAGTRALCRKFSEIENKYIEKQQDEANVRGIVRDEMRKMALK